MEDIKNPNNPDESSLNQSRSYLCSFCIRGFSNAQALGGHMNIHRRDRANLRQKLMEDNKDDVLAESDSSEVVSLDLNERQQEEEEEEALPCDDDDDDQHQDMNQDHDMEKDKSPDQKLGFGVQENKLDDTSDHGKVKEVSIDGSSSSHHSDVEGLDLELRLGQSVVAKKKT